ncbi:hypothetical protein TRICI_002896 [Trichomonascus ciferrii]|uniref:Transcription factor domain-containing protein n=1 Tax=Trichomonascus ciferrii TaxID=44093 RepID=A0A642V5J1_9ASCO|nr:hypothetical protein TRICI_002896 [Trichomonascus ciferrii]
MTQVLDCDSVLRLLDQEPSRSSYALAHGVAYCGLILTDLRLSPIEQPLTERLFKEAVRPRLRDIITEECAYANYFLFVAYFDTEDFPVALIYMRETLTILQLLRLDREDTYEGLAPSDAHRLRKLFFTLFLTERGVSLLTNFPLTLKNSISYPDIRDDPSTHAIVSLAKLFAVVDDYLLVLGNSEMGDFLATSLYERIEKSKELSHSIQSDVHRTDFLITTEWMRLLIWKAFNPGATNPELIQSIARSLVKLGREISSADFLRIHGVGMAMKLSVILFSVADAYGMRSACDGLVSDEPDPGRRIKKLLDLITTLSESLPDLRLATATDTSKSGLESSALAYSTTVPTSNTYQPLKLSSALFGNSEYFLDMFSGDFYNYPDQTTP